MVSARLLSYIASAAILVSAGCAASSESGSAGDAAAAGMARPYGGMPASIPGKIEAEHFDEGPDGLVYHDLDPENQGVPYRRTTIDIEARNDASNGHGIGWTRGGEWVIYTVNVTMTGKYSIHIPLASPNVGGTFHLEADGKDVTGPIQVPNTGSWQKLQAITIPGVELRGGVRTLRLSFDTDGPETKSVADIDCFIFERERA